MTQEGELVKLMVDEHQLKSRLFCYMSVDNIDRILDVFRNCHLWFSKPTDFNDPFDCQIYPNGISSDYLAEHLHNSSVPNVPIGILKTLIRNTKSKKNSSLQMI